MSRDKRCVCQQDKKDCFAYMEGGLCYCLDDTNFDGRECPFYKKENEVSHHILVGKYLEEERRAK